MLSRLQQHHDSQISRPVPWAIQHSLRLLVAGVIFASLQAVAFSQVEPRFQPDGAPGENLAPGADGGPFAQAATEEADAAADDDETALSEKDDSPRSQKNLDNIDFRVPISRSKQTAWQKIELAVEGRDWGDVLPDGRRLEHRSEAKEPIVSAGSERPSPRATCSRQPRDDRSTFLDQSL